METTATRDPRTDHAHPQHRELLPACYPACQAPPRRPAIGDLVSFYAFGATRTGTVEKVGRTRVTVSYATKAARRRAEQAERRLGRPFEVWRNRRAFPIGSPDVRLVRPAEARVGESFDRLARALGAGR